jgi:hypothetical protein
MALQQRFKRGFILATDKPHQEFSVRQLRSGYASQPADVLQESLKVSGRHSVGFPTVLPGLYLDSAGLSQKISLSWGETIAKNPIMS